MAIAAILAFYTSRIIAHPINTVTNIAQRVTQDALSVAVKPAA